MRRWKHMDKVMAALQYYVGSNPGEIPGTRVLAQLECFRPGGRHVHSYMVVCPRGQEGWMSSFVNNRLLNVHTRVQMPQSFREWTVARAHGPMKPFNYMLTEGDKRGLKQAGFIDLPE